MSEDPTVRIARWNTKYNTERIKAVLDEMRPMMYARVQAVFPQITAMEQQVKQVLDGSGVSTRDYAHYLCFGREIWSLTRRDISGESAAREVATLAQKWVSRGLTLSVLELIRTQVFNIGPVSGP